MNRRSVLVGLGAVGMVRSVGASRIPGLGVDPTGLEGLTDTPARIDHIHQFWKAWEPVEMNSGAGWDVGGHSSLDDYPPARVCRSSDLLMLDLAFRGNFPTSHIIGYVPVGFRPVKTKSFKSVKLLISGGAPFTTRFVEEIRLLPDGELHHIFDNAISAPSGSEAVWFCQNRLYRDD